MRRHFGVIFDMDGVLIDSFEAHYQSWVKLGQQYGFSMTRDEFNETFGRTSREVIRDHLSHLIQSDDDVMAMDHAKEEYFRAELEQSFPAMPGAGELIDSLAEAGFQVAIGSSGPIDNVRLTIRELGIGDKLQAVVSGSDVTRGKPDPEIFLTAAEKMGVTPQGCLVVEDSEFGVAAALAADMLCIALLSTGHQPEETSRAHKQVRSLKEITPELVEELITSTV